MNSIWQLEGSSIVTVPSAVVQVAPANALVAESTGAAKASVPRRRRERELFICRLVS
jgi:hypothetical protein